MSVDLEVGGAIACQLLCGGCIEDELPADDGVCEQLVPSLVGEAPFGYRIKFGSVLTMCSSRCRRNLLRDLKIIEVHH